MFKGKKILITGGTGSLGKALAKRLLEMDAEIDRVDGDEKLCCH